jgi:hypothetical protein
MKPRPGTTALVATLLFAASAGPAAAWGDLGHRMVTETAALLVERDLPDTWGPLLARHRFQLGYDSFLPDALFRRIDGAQGRLEASTHFLHLDRLAGDPRPSRQFGSVPWRTAQLLALARDQVGSVRQVRGGYQSGAAAGGDLKRVHAGLTLLGLMSHYSADAAVPHHATSDWNSDAEGQGGLHYYFESDCVAALEPELSARVLDSALKNRARWLAEWKVDGQPPAGVVLRLLSDSAEALPGLLALDRRKVVTTLAAPGREADAVRRAPREGCRAMRALLVERLAKGAVATAYLWETALPRDVDFSGGGKLYFSDFEPSPDYVAPDYLTSE